MREQCVEYSHVFVCIWNATHAEHAVMPTDIHDPAQDAPVLDHAMQLASDWTAE